MNVNIQRAILSTFLWSDDLHIDKTDSFILDLDLFDDPMRRGIAENINNTTLHHDKMYGFLNVQIEGIVAYQYEWLEISTQTPLTFSVAKRYMDSLAKKRRDKLIMGIL
jgi:hypothetical protein